MMLIRAFGWTLGTIAILVLLGASAAHADGAIAGRWTGAARVAGADIPFRLDLKQSKGEIRAIFFDGARPTNPSAPGRLEGDRLHLAFPSYAAELDLTVSPGALDGVYLRNHASTPVHAVRFTRGAKPGGPAPRIAGEWIIPKASGKGEKAWRLIVRQSGSAVEAAILRVDGDTGALAGDFANGVFRLSHFAGERPASLEIRPRRDGSLQLGLDDGDGHSDLIALRPNQAQAQGYAPADPTRFTGVNSPSEPFQFAFNDLDGRRVSNTDPRFRGKVVVVDIMGSWCPNCHDEAPYLQSLYVKHRKQGLEVVALDFEQADQLADPQRLRAFVQRYGISYTVLLAGEVKDVHEKLPQMSNFGAWPTTFFLGRDGRVKQVHVGFTSPASGARDIETRAAVEREVQALLAERGSRS